MKGQRERDDEDQNTAHCTHSHPINGPRTLLPLLSMFHPVPPLALPDHDLLSPVRVNRLFRANHTAQAMSLHSAIQCTV